MDMAQEIVTVRPAITSDTVQQLPHYIGISNNTACAKGLSMNLVVIPA
ncbi:hypothetical protein MNBD_GAMMA12-1594 [hydrothermal vent metagenome]|uniref:Uncharacterized protein n=1 Tax=hydrothermal vent metagenome TaxID=652676 RepID=A0A3B0YNA5_9ZZZZ